MDKKLLEILVCPQCKGSLESADGGSGLVCRSCQLKYPVRDNIPIMLVEEAVSLKGIPYASGAPCRIATFRVISGPNLGLVFHLDRSTCKAIGRSIADPNKTTMFDVDVALSLDEGTKGIIQKYIERQFKGRAAAARDEGTGGFKRTSDVVLDDMAVSRLHVMVFHDEAGVGILDMVSKNGTFVNGEEIESRLLRKGDTIEIGETKIVYEG